MRGRKMGIALTVASTTVLAAVGTPGASASNLLTADSYPALITATQELSAKHVFTLTDDEGIKTRM